MFGNICIDFGYRFVFGFCSEGEQRFAPTLPVGIIIFILAWMLSYPLFVIQSYNYLSLSEKRYQQL